MLGTGVAKTTIKMPWEYSRDIRVPIRTRNYKKRRGKKWEQEVVLRSISDMVQMGME